MFNNVYLTGNFIIVGPQGCGKSSTGNTLLSNYDGHPYFGIGDDLGRGTIETKRVNCGKIEIIDCVGFGNNANKNNTFKENSFILQKEFFANDLINSQLKYKHYKLLFCIKFDRYNQPNYQFLNAVKQFVEIFGERGVQSMVIVAIQEKNALCLGDFLQKMKKTDGYEYLVENMSNSSHREIPVCLWENYRLTYPNQKYNLLKCLKNVGDFEFIDISTKVVNSKMTPFKDQKEIHINHQYEKLKRPNENKINNSGINLNLFFF